MTVVTAYCKYVIVTNKSNIHKFCILHSWAKRARNFLLYFVCLLTVTSCADTMHRLKNVGKAPAMTSVNVPLNESQIAEAENAQRKKIIRTKSTNSLWQPGSISFFRDTRAWKVGDILAVAVVIHDSAQLKNTSSQSRKGGDAIGIRKIFGAEKVIQKKLGVASLNPILDESSSNAYKGDGGISRNESITTKIAAIVTQVLPNGNLVIQGHQEVRVNHELREIKIVGVIRSKDIGADNSIKSEQIAEARISYGGRGSVSDVQQPRIGSQVVDILSPF